MSHKINLDFTECQIFAFKRLTILGFIIFLLGLIVALYVAREYMVQDDAFERVKEKLDSTFTENLQQSVKVQADIVPPEQLNEVQEVVQTLVTPWETLFLAIEQADIPDVALLSIEPSKEKQRLVLTGQSKNIQATFQYLQRLQALPMLTHVYLQNHKVAESDPFKPVNFTIVGQWK